MRRLLMIATVAAMLFPAVQAWADMTDSQVMKAVVELHDKGYSEMEIAKQLLRDGATVSQLQRVRQKALEMQNQAENASKKESAGTKTTSSTLRTDNGETIDFDELHKYASETKQIFGHDVFRQKDLTFAPQMNIATPQNYILGPGDEVNVDLTGATAMHINGTVSPEGTVDIDNYGPVKISGLTTSQASQRLQGTAGSRYGGTQFKVSVGQTRSISVNVMGEVQVPGSYTLSAFATVFHALYKAGGVNEIGTLRNIKVFRNNQLVSLVDVYDYLMNGVMTGNIALEDGDIIIVGSYDALVEVEGRVKRPMYYEMRQNESVGKLLTYAGGFAADAYTNVVRIERKSGSAWSSHSVRNDQLEQFLMRDGDVVTVDSILLRHENSVEVKGAVKHPGRFGLTDNLKTVYDVVEMAGGTSEDAAIGRAVLYRMQLDRTLQAYPIDLLSILTQRSGDVQLKNEDQLFIPSKKEELEKMFVVIHGEVYEPDTFQYASNESVEDLILRAGGLKTSASTSKVDIARRVVDSKSTTENPLKTQTFTIALSDSLRPNQTGFLLEPFDEVYIRRSPAYGRQQNVSVRGEILFEGTYALKTQDDRLSDLVRQAGGTSSHAYLKGARLLRQMTEEERIKRDQMLKMNKGRDEDSISLDKLDIEDSYFVGIDLEQALKNPGGDEDIVLREGDQLLIPSLNNTVKINGEVLHANTVSYRKGKRARYYVNQAGGFSSNARSSKTYIIYASGKVTTARKGKPQAGSEVVVPAKPDRNTTQNVSMWMSIGTTTASLASVIATIIAVVRK